MALRAANAIRYLRTWFGIDQLGAGTARAGDTITTLNLSGRGIPQGIRAGMKGASVNTFSGDLGPLQGFPVVGHARRAVRSGMDKGLPATNGTPTAPSTTQALLGPDPF